MTYKFQRPFKEVQRRYLVNQGPRAAKIWENGTDFAF